MRSTVPNFSAPAEAATALAQADHAARGHSDRMLSALLLAAAVAALAVTVNQLMDTWAEDHLLTAWVALWAVVFAGSLLLAGTAQRVAHSIMARLEPRAQAAASTHNHAMGSRGCIKVGGRNMPHYI